VADKKGLNRRDFLKNAGISAAGLAIVASGAGALWTPKKASAAVEAPNWPEDFSRNYKELDLEAVKERAYYSYKEAG